MSWKNKVQEILHQQLSFPWLRQIVLQKCFCSANCSNVSRKSTKFTLTCETVLLKLNFRDYFELFSKLKTVLKVFFGMSNNLRRMRDVTFIDCVTSFISSTFCCELGWKIINQWTEKTLKVKLHKNGKLTLISGNPFLQEPAEINRKRQITVRVLLYNNRLFYSCVLSYPATE